jgi:periplasmic protein CpxP/Spy
MPHALDRLKYPAALQALAGAVLMLSLGIAADSATAQTGNKQPPAQAQSPAGQKPAAAPKETPAADNPIDAHLAELKTQLNITAAQQPKFDEFAKVLKQNAETMDTAMQKAQQSAGQSAVEGLRAAASLTQTEADNLKRLVPALEGLYATLSAEQKRTADEMFSAGSSSGASPDTAPGRPPG